MIQGEALKRVRGRVYEKKRDQRELIKVGQRNFRKYMAMREWGWFVIIQKTRPLIGRPDPNEELRIVEEKAALMDEIARSQGDLSQYRERQGKCASQKADLEIALSEAQDKLARTEQARVQATADKKNLEQETVAIKKDIADIEMAINKLEQEKTNRDHTIKSLNDEIANQDEIINKLNK